MKTQLAIVISAVLFSGSVLAAPNGSTNTSGMDITDSDINRNATGSLYQDNYSNVKIKNSDRNNVLIDQSTPGTTNGHDAVVLIQGTSSLRNNDNDVAIEQDGNKHDAIVKLINDADNNNIDITQSGLNGDVYVHFAESDNNSLVVEQSGEGNNAKVLAVGTDPDALHADNNTNIKLYQDGNFNNGFINLKENSDSNVLISLSQTGDDNVGAIVLKNSQNNSVDVAQDGDYNEASVRLNMSNNNTVNVNQGDLNVAHVSLDMSDNNLIDVDQTTSGSHTDVNLSGSHGNSVGNSLHGSSGIYVMQTMADYANVSLVNSHDNAVAILQN